MKKTCMVLLVMALLFAPFNMLPVHADDLSGDFYYIEHPDSVMITGYTDTAPRDHVVIPQEINGKAVTAIGDEAFQNKSIQSVELPDGLVSLGTKAFYNNPLTSLEIPESVKDIGHGAFQINKLTSLTLNDGVEKIGKNAFTNNELTALHLPDSVTELGANAFQSNKIADIRLSDSLTEISDYAFANNKLHSLDIPANVQIIGNSAFTGNRILQLVIPETIVTVKKEAFHYNALESVTFLGTPILEDDMGDVNKGFFNQYSDATNSNLYNWYTDSGYTQVWNKTVAATPASPLTIYAAWKSNYVTFDTNGGSGGVRRQVNFGQTTTATVSSKTEHTLEGWYTEKEHINKWNFDTDIVIRNITLYAKWIANTYTVNFNLNGGTGVVPSQTIEYNGKALSPANPSRAGHTFEGWYTNLGSTTPWNFDTDQVKGNMTLNAKWTVSTHKVTFQTNGGTPVTAQSIVHDGKVVLPVDPAKPGHTLVGWYTDSDLTTAWDFNADKVTEDITLYAKWTANTHTVNFQSNGGSAVVEQVIAYDNKVVLPANPSKAEHTFMGWYVDSNLTAAWNFNTNVVTRNMTLYAKWTANTYTVSFDSDGGSAVTGQTIAYDDKVISPPAPTKPGHIFAGWYIESSLTTIWDFDVNQVKGNMTLYAKWTANTFTVSFDSNGGSAVTEQTIAYDDKVVAPPAPTKPGHTFAGWHNESSLTTIWDFDADQVKGNMTLYAKWTANTYTVSFNSDGGSAVTEQTIAYDDKVVAPPAPTKPGNTFSGWYNESNLTTIWDFDADQVKGNMTLYAKWTANTYTISFNTDGGSAVTEQTIAYDDKVELPAPPIKTGHVFIGWFKDEDLTIIWNFTTDVITANMTLYAKWKKNSYVVAPEPTIDSEPLPELTPEPITEPIPEEEPIQNICSTDFTDTSNHWAEYAITDIASRCIIIGFPDGEFKPNAPLIRAHVAVMFTRAFELSANRASNSFYDVSNNSPYYEAIMKVAQAGIFEGTDGYFYPEQQLTRAQMAKILAIAFNLPVGEKSTFRDVPETHWASSYIAALESQDLTSSEDGNYKPEELVTRAQFVTFMYRALRL